jgi:hypothetical protein
MTRGSLRADEAWLREYAAKRNRFTTVPDKSGQVDQRPAALDPPALTPPLATGDGGAPNAGIAFVVGTPMPAGVVTTATSPSKYRNKPTNGYASIKESKRALQLKLMQEAGQIRNLREQVSFLLIPKQEGERACSYVADFCYEEYAPRFPGVIAASPWEPVVEDVKSPASRTDAYIIKRKLMRFVHGVTIRET